MSAPEKEDKEEDHHPYRRPKDAATLILVDRSGSVPKVLVGRRHDKVVFMPGKFVFPGGRVDATDSRIPVAAQIPAALEKKLMAGSPKIEPSRARALAVAAIREACEETGLCLGRQPATMARSDAAKLSGEWKPFADCGLLPDPSGLFLIARAITPPGRVRRFDTRFLAAWRGDVAVALADGSPTNELEELVWLPLGEAKQADIPTITRTILGELETRLAADPDLRPGGAVPFYRMLHNRFQREVL
jgi:8-oxo-dGTP pyrophosphatase MutT (NUDIX family)